MRHVAKWSIQAGILGLVALLPITSAQAQSSVTLYGVLDAGALYTSKTPNAAGTNAGATFSFVNGGFFPSQFGIKGKEDLGNGYSAIFDLQSGIDLGTGGADNNLTGSLFGRQSWVGLDSPYGRVRLGVQFSPFEDAMFALDPRGFSQMGSAITMYSADALTGTFSPNAISWWSPEMHGFQVRLMTGLGGTAGNFRAGFGYSGMASYEINGFKFVAGAIDQAAAIGTSATDPAYLFTVPVVAKVLGVAYSFPNITFKASYASFNAPSLLGNSLDGSNDIYNIGFDWNITPSIESDAGISYIQDPHISSSHALQIATGAYYHLSKRSTLWSQLTVVDNHGGEHIGPTVENGDLVGVTGTTVAVGVGIKHTF